MASSLRRTGPTTRGQIQSLYTRLKKTEDIAKRMQDFICESSRPVHPEDMPARKDKLGKMLREYKRHESCTLGLQNEVEKAQGNCPKEDLKKLSEYHAKLFKTEKFAKIGDMLRARATVYGEWTTHTEGHEAAQAQLHEIRERLSSSDVQTEEVFQMMAEVQVLLGKRREEATSLCERMKSTQLCVKDPVSKRCTLLQDNIQELERLCGELESMAQTTLPPALCKLGTPAGYRHDSPGNLLRRRHASRTSSGCSGLARHGSADSDTELHSAPHQNPDSAASSQNSEVLCQSQEDATPAAVNTPSSQQRSTSGTGAYCPLNIGHVSKVAITVHESVSEDSPRLPEEDDSVFDSNSLSVSPTSGLLGLPVNIGRADTVAINMTNASARFDWSETSKESSAQQKKDKGRIRKIQDDIRRLSQKIETDITDRHTDLITDRHTDLISQMVQLVKDRENKEEHLRKLTEKECVVIYYLRPKEEDVKTLRDRHTSLQDKELTILADALYKRFTIRLLAISQDFVFFLDVPHTQAQALITNLSTILDMIQDILFKDFNHTVAWQPLSVCNPWDVWKMGKQQQQQQQQQQQKGSKKEVEGDDWKRKTSKVQCTTERLEALLQQEKQQVETKEKQIQALQRKVSENTEQEFTLERLTSLLEKEKQEGASKDELIQELQARLAEMKDLQVHLEREQENVAASGLIQELKARLQEAASVLAQQCKERDEERKEKNKELEKFMQLIKDLDGRNTKLEKQLQEERDARQQLEEEKKRKTLQN
ncbi:kinectin-like isoform X2 [Littorina saxatilis]|uniref:kinectin-like isoform X2 n=1 Tax=Littorina saxatilis TaxID=31220 RepID=UPI0038B42DDE